MIWVTWRQFRATILAGVLVPLVLAAATVAITLSVRDRTVGVWFSRCAIYATSECAAETAMTFAGVATIALPVLLGMFVGVTVFSRDIERRTHVLGLTQSVGRMRWYWTRVLVVFVPVVAAMLVLGVASLWARYLSFSGTFSFFGTLPSRLDFPAFGAVGIVPAAYTALGLVVGSTCALVLRHTVGAMIATLVVTVLALVLFPTQIREHYATATVENQTLETRLGISSAMTYADFPADAFYPRWVVSENFIDTQGRSVAVEYDTCQSSEDTWTDPNPGESADAYNDRLDALWVQSTERRIECLRASGVDHFEYRYHPDQQFWRFQLTEAALSLLAVGVLASASTLLVRRLRP